MTGTWIDVFTKETREMIRMEAQRIPAALRIAAVARVYRRIGDLRRQAPTLAIIQAAFMFPEDTRSTLFDPGPPAVPTVAPWED